MVPTAEGALGGAVGTVALGWGAEVTDTLCAISGPINHTHDLASVM
jgi:hypothetical protein